MTTSKEINIIICGVGGQGVVLLSELLGNAAVRVVFLTGMHARIPGRARGCILPLVDKGESKIPPDYSAGIHSRAGSIFRKRA